MNRFCNRVASSRLAPVAAGLWLSLSLAGCAEPPGTTARSGADARLPADGAPGPAADALKTKTLTNEEWTRVTTINVKPACDARSGAGQPDEVVLKNAGVVMSSWMTFVKQPKPGPKTDDGKKIGGGAEPTRSVKTIGMTCSPTKNTVEVNGVDYPFDIAWVVSGKGSGPSISGGVGAGNFAMVEALSLKDKKVVLAKVYVPGDGNDDSDDTIVVTNLAGYLPEDADQPITRATGEKEDPIFETFVFAKGAKTGFAFQVPRQDALGRARYLAAGKFTVQ